MRYLRSLCLGLSCAGLTVATLTSPATATAPLATRKMSFSIPFSAGDTADRVVELYVSSDKGQNWQLYSTQPSKSRQFQFRATSPGEYWFASRLVGPSRSAVRPADIAPELQVLIDLDEPQLNFESKCVPTGEVLSEWRVSDASLDARTLKIEYQTHPSQGWRAIAINAQQSRSVNQFLVGKMSWTPEGASQAVQVRAEITDRAGNKAVVNRVVLIPSREDADSSGRTASVPTDPFRHAQQLAQQAITWPSDNRLPAENEPQRASDLREQFVHRLAPRETDEVNAGQSQTAGSATPYPNPTPLPDEEPTPVVSQLAGQRVAEPPAGRSGLPDGEQPRMTRSREFQLDYSVESVGPSGLLKVELWGTSDLGETWSVWKLDDDRSSPIDVVVEDERVYGFRVVVVAKNGLAGAVPRNGDPAELWVGVDATPPAVQIDSAAYGDDRHFGQLDIRWSASDPWLNNLPITLLFSDQATGPWTTIRAGLENSGQYYWPIDPRVPDKIYLKIEARDDAGNVGVHQVAEPINTGGLTPQAHIRGIRSLHQAADD